MSSLIPVYTQVYKEPVAFQKALGYAFEGLVNAGVANNLTVQLSYGIGLAIPISVHAYGDLNEDEELVCKLINEGFEPTPYNIIETLRLKEFSRFYRQTATYGHFGNPDYPWEELDKYQEIKDWLANNKA